MQKKQKKKKEKVKEALWMDDLRIGKNKKNRRKESCGGVLVGQKPALVRGGIKDRVNSP